MLRLTLELLPEGNPQRARTLARLDIWNTGEGSDTHSHYAAEIHEADRTSRRVSVGLLNRRASTTWHLVTRALYALGYAPPEPTDRAVLADMLARLPGLIERERPRVNEMIRHDLEGDNETT